MISSPRKQDINDLNSAQNIWNERFKVKTPKPKEFKRGDRVYFYKPNSTHIIEFIGTIAVVHNNSAQVYIEACDKDSANTAYDLNWTVNVAYKDLEALE